LTYSASEARQRRS